jgi:uncharacterized protein involved in exopolysaccharide biosynthesis
MRVKRSSEPPDGALGETEPSTRRVARTTADEIPLIGLFNVVLRHRDGIVALTLLAVGAAVAFSLLRPREYTATAVFMPQTSPGQRTGLATVAAQFGVNVSSGEPGQSPVFYAELLRSPGILRTTVETRYLLDSDPARGTTLVDIYVPKGARYEARRARAIQRLRDATRVSTGRETGLVTFSVTDRSPALAGQVARRMLDQVHEFNLKSRQERAAAERRFSEERLEQVRQELRNAEAQLEAFQRQNRQFRASPELALTYDRLARAVSMRQELYTSVMQSYEQARIDEVRNTPVIAVVEEPVPPAEPDPRHVLRNSVLALLVGLTLGIFVALTREVMWTSRGIHPEEFATYVTLRNAAIADLRRPLRWLQRMSRRLRTG